MGRFRGATPSENNLGGGVDPVISTSLSFSGI